MKKTIGIALGGFMAAAILGAGLYMFVLKGSPSDAVAAVAPTPVHFEGRLGPHIVLEDRVYNLASSGGARRFLKMSVVIEFETTDSTWLKASGHGLEARLEEFEHEIGSGKALIEDAVNTIVSQHTAEELATAQGKDRLRQEIHKAVKELIHEPHVSRVLFTTFIAD